MDNPARTCTRGPPGTSFRWLSGLIDDIDQEDPPLTKSSTHSGSWCRRRRGRIEPAQFDGRKRTEFLARQFDGPEVGPDDAEASPSRVVCIRPSMMNRR